MTSLSDSEKLFNMFEALLVKMVDIFDAMIGDLIILSYFYG